MIRLTIKAISTITIIIAKIIVFGIPAFIIPLVILYASRLNAESINHNPVPDPLEGHSIVKIPQKPEIISIPVPTQSIRKGAIISQSDLKLQDISSDLLTDMIAQDIMQLVGQEAKKGLYENKPILLRDVGTMTIVKRNDTVTLLFQQGAMTLQTIGRALEDGGVGDSIKVINEKSKKIITGHITKNGEVDVSL